MGDNLRDQLRALTNLAIEGFGQGQEICAGATDAADRLAEMIGALREKQQSAHTLAVGAIGTSNNPPEPALNMVGSSSAASSTIDDVDAALQLLLVRIAAVHASLGAAGESGRQYLAII